MCNNRAYLVARFRHVRCLVKMSRVNLPAIVRAKSRVRIARGQEIANNDRAASARIGIGIGFLSVARPRKIPAAKVRDRRFRDATAAIRISDI